MLHTTWVQYTRNRRFPTRIPFCRFTTTPAVQRSAAPFVISQSHSVRVVRVPSCLPLSPTHHPGEQPDVRRLVVNCRLRELPTVLWPAVIKVAIGLRSRLRLDPLDRVASVPV